MTTDIDPGLTSAAAAAFITLCALLIHLRWTPRAVRLGPTLLTTLGIFFCFLGIAIGLLHFNPDDVKAGVPRLLAGVRLAFWSSVAGIFYALTVKFRLLFGGEPRAGRGDRAGATVADLAALLAQLQQSVAGAGDASLLGETARLRRDQNERLDRLCGSLEHFMARAADANSRALTEALERLARTYNVRINEQLGDQLTHLNRALDTLIDWQKEYRAILERLIEQETAARRSIADVDGRSAEFAGEVRSFEKLLPMLDQILGKLANRIDYIDQAFFDLHALVTETRTGLPSIGARVGEMTRQLEAGIRANNEQLAAALKATIAGTKAHGQLLFETHAALAAELRQAAADTKRHAAALDAALEAQLRQGIETIGRHLAALPRSLADDNRQAAERSQRLVEARRG